MGKIFSRIKPLVKRVVTAMVQKQIENAITKVRRGIEKELFGIAMDVTNRPFQNSNLRKQFPNINELPNHRALNKLQKERLEKKKERKRKRQEEVKEGKRLVEVAGKEALAQAEDAVLSLAETSLGLMNDMADLAMATVAEAVKLARGVFETYVRVFTDLGTSGDKVVENSIDLVKTMVSAATAIVGTCAVCPTVTPGALPQFIFAVKSKSDALGTELSKFKSSLSEARGLIDNLPDFPGKDEILDVLEFADTLTIGPQTLILTTGGLICLLEVDVESFAVTALEGIVGDMAGPLVALATNKASLCDNWRLISSIEETLTDEELLEYELKWEKHTWDNCRNFEAIEFEVDTDDLGVPKTANDGSILYKLDSFNNKVPSKKGCENCKRYKKNESKAKEEEEKGGS
jgi:hypothetical protein